MDNKTRCVDYGRDIAELAMEVLEQSKEIAILCKEIAALRRQLEAQGMLYGGAVARAAYYVDDSFPISVDGFQTTFGCRTE